MKVPKREYGFAMLAVACSTLICFAIFPHLALTNLVMIYLLGTLAVAARGHRGPAALSATLSVLCFDFFFVPPRFTLNVSDVQYLFTFAVMFATAMIISDLTIRLREEAEAARQGELRTRKAEWDAETERVRSSLLSSVSHDFRTPLAAIVGSAGTLLTKEEILKNSGFRELLENIQTEGERLSRLVQNLLEVARLESVRARKELYPLEEVVGSALDRTKKTMTGRNVQVAIPENLPLIPMDAVLMEQALINLLENGNRHTPKGSPLELSAWVDGDHVTIEIADQGPGLSAEDLAHAFDKFYHNPSSEGAGLGLAICRAILSAHGGRITAGNRPGGGAMFRLMLPLTY